MNVRHWSVPKETFGGGDRARTKWELEERINFGVGAREISREVLSAHWKELDIDPWKRRALSLVL